MKRERGKQFPAEKGTLGLAGYGERTATPTNELLQGFNSVRNL